MIVHCLGLFRESNGLPVRIPLPHRRVCPSPGPWDKPGFTPGSTGRKAHRTQVPPDTCAYVVDLMGDNIF